MTHESLLFRFNSFQIIASHTSTVVRLDGMAWLAAWFGIGKGLIQKIGKLKLRQENIKIPESYSPPEFGGGGDNMQHSTTCSLQVSNQLPAS